MQIFQKEVVNEMTTVTWTHFDEVMAVAPYFKGGCKFSRIILRGIPIPLHPGAYQYFQRSRI